MQTRNIVAVVTLVLLATVLSSSAQAEELNLDFKLVNSTGYTIKELYIAPSSSKDWGENILKKKLQDGETLAITFHPKATATKWDICITWEDGGEQVTWEGNKLTEITKITLKYNDKTGATTAVVE